MHLDGEYIKGDIDNYNLSVIIYQFLFRMDLPSKDKLFFCVHAVFFFIF